MDDKNYDKVLQELVIDKLKEMDDNDLIYLWNEYCETDSCVAKLYDMSDFDNTVDDITGSVSEVINKVREDFDDVDLDDRYFYFDDSDICKSTNDPFDVVYLPDLADALIDEKVENNLVDMDKLHRLARAQTCAFRPLKDADELRKLLNNFIERAVYVRGKDWNANDFMWLRLNSYGVRDGVLTFSLGNMCMTAQEWFDKYEFSLTGAMNEYQPFGVAGTEENENE